MLFSAMQTTWMLHVARDLVDPLCVCDNVDRKPDVIGLIGLRDSKVIGLNTFMAFFFFFFFFFFV